MPTTEKYSRQREAVLKELMSRTDHPTADEIYDAVRKNIPNISLGTVYRNLAMLEKRGRILKITTNLSGDRFDGNSKPHYHFTCTKCGAVSDVHMPEVAELNEKAARYTDGKIASHTVMFDGVCGGCLNK